MVFLSVQMFENGLLLLLPERRNLQQQKGDI